MSEISTLLQQSRAANDERKRAANKRPANYTVAEQHAAKALELRIQAHDADPEHSDPEWANDKVPHQQMVDFLKTYASIP